MSGMEDLDDFGTEEEEEEEIRQRRGKRAARFDSDSDDEYDESAKAPPRPVSKVAVTPKQPISKRKRVSDATDRTPKRTRVTVGGRNGVLEGGSPSNGPLEEKEGDAMDQDSQGEETLEVEQNLFYPSDEETIVRWVQRLMHSLPRIHVPIDHTTTPLGAHQSDLPNPLELATQLHLLPKPSILLNLVNQSTDLTAPRTPPQALFPQLTLMNRKTNRHLYPSASGNEQFRRSSKVRLVGTSKMALFVLLKSVLTRHQNQSLSFLSRDVRPGRLGLLRTRKLVLLGMM